MTDRQPTIRQYAHQVREKLADGPYPELTVAPVVIVRLARRIATSAPAKRGRYVHAAGIPWSLIEELRDALDEFGIVWRP